MNAYILVAANAELARGGWVPAREIARRRLEARRWCLYRKTPHKKHILVGDRIVVYLAGKGAGEFVAKTSVRRLRLDDLRSPDGNDVDVTPAALTLELDAAEWFPNAVSMLDIRHQLDFMPPPPGKWGHLLQAGIKLIGQKDYETIVASALRSTPGTTASVPRRTN